MANNLASGPDYDMSMIINQHQLEIVPSTVQVSTAYPQPTSSSLGTAPPFAQASTSHPQPLYGQNLGTASSFPQTSTSHPQPLYGQFFQNVSYHDKVHAPFHRNDLKHIILDCCYLQLEKLNSIIESMELGYMESDRPAPIKPETLSSDSHSLKQKAMQSWLLSRLIPVMIGVDIPEDDPFWANYLRMLEITDYLFAPEITSDEVAYIKVLIEEHHTTFAELYPAASVIPKMHYLVHAPRLILKFGPLVRHWTMRYEAKHSYFKKLIQNIGNYKNVSWTLSKRHQMLQCYNHHSGDIFRQDRLEVGPGDRVATGSRPSELQDEESCYKAKWVKVDGIIYKSDTAIGSIRLKSPCVPMNPTDKSTLCRTKNFTMFYEY